MTATRSFVVCCATVAAFVGTAVSGETFTSKEGRFRVSVPSRPTLQKITDKSTSEPIDSYLYTVDSNEGALIVSYFDLRAGVPPADRTDAILEQRASVLVGSTKGTVIKAEKTKHRGAPALDVAWSFERDKIKGRARARIMLVGERIYHVFVVGTDSFLKSETAIDFLQSFTFEGVREVSVLARPDAPANVNPAGEWQPFNARNNDGGYSVEFPGKPDKEQAPGILGVKARTVFTCSANGLTFAVSGQPVPAPAARTNGTQGVLNAARVALALNHSGKVRSDKALQIGNYAAREVWVTAASLRPNVIRARTVLVGKRLYVVTVTGPEADVSGPSAQRFFDSFVPIEGKQ